MMNADPHPVEPTSTPARSVEPSFAAAEGCVNPNRRRKKIRRRALQNQAFVFAMPFGIVNLPF